MSFNPKSHTSNLMTHNLAPMLHPHTQHAVPNLPCSRCTIWQFPTSYALNVQSGSSDLICSQCTIRLFPTSYALNVQSGSSRPMFSMYNQAVSDLPCSQHTIQAVPDLPCSQHTIQAVPNLPCSQHTIQAIPDLPCSQHTIRQFPTSHALNVQSSMQLSHSQCTQSTFTDVEHLHELQASTPLLYSWRCQHL